jgi:hypothetical protein
MRLVLLASCTLLVMGVASAASGDRVYRWKGQDGKVHYGDTPPAGAQEVRPFDSKVGGPSGSHSAQAPDTAPMQYTEEQIAARDADCANKRTQLKTYRNAARLVERDALGREHEYSVEERQQLVSRTEADIQSLCGDTPQE